MQTLSNSTDASLNSKLAIDAQAVGNLRGKLSKDPTGTAHQVAQQFEKMFLDMVLKSMRDATPKFDALESETVGTFRSMYDQQLTQSLSSSGRGFGIGAMVAKQIEHTADPSSYDKPIHQPAHAVLTPKTTATTDSTADTQQAREQAFLSNVGDAAQGAAETLGLSPHLLLAHAALESGWGRKPIVDSKGQNTHNLFGVKAGSGWTGKTADIVTTEYVGGVAQKRVETFRAYDSYQDAFADYAKVMSKHFSSATNAKSDAKTFATALQQGGYATDPNYAVKLTHVAQNHLLQAYRTA